jgi:predicted transcriptional regulator
LLDLKPGEPQMAEPKTKERVLDAVRVLPEDATVEDAMERLCFLAKIEEGLRQVEAGETVSHEEARAHIFGMRLHRPMEPWLTRGSWG